MIQPSEKAIAFLTPPFEARRTITPTIVHGVSALRIVIGMRSTRRRPSDRYAEGRAGADHVERRAAGARELARPRREPALLDPRDRLRELGLELGQLLAPNDGLDERVGPLQELVDDLDLLRPGPEAGDCVDEALQPVLGLDDLGGRVVAEQRSTCSRRRARGRPSRWSTSRTPWKRTPSCSNANGRSTVTPSSAASRAASGEAQ